MKKIIVSLIALATILASCSTSKNAATTSTTDSTVSHPQDALSFATAVVINKKSEMEGVDAEYSWIKKHYSNYQVQGQALRTFEKRAHDVITIQLANGEKVDLYFDISKFFGKL